MPQKTLPIDNAQLRSFLIDHEDLLLLPKPDPIQPDTIGTSVLGGPRRRVIGVGRNIDETGFSQDELDMFEENTVNMGLQTRDINKDGITKEEALILLGNDIRTRSQDIQKLIPQFSQFSPAQQAALISLHFTTGSGGFRGFDNMIKALNESRPNFSRASKEMLNSKRFRDRQVSERRALQEASMLETGRFIQ